ncbi:hypothetical protein DL93DRAFT_2074566 [Clavulina sp. PMI_390]|nr:hypothetical protein DL93DRAFT_2074566 [Clavulina sp. PMI_390]
MYNLLWTPPRLIARNAVKGEQARLLRLLAEMPTRDVTFSGRLTDDNVIFLMLQAFNRTASLRFYETYQHGKLLNRICQALEQRSNVSEPNINLDTDLFLPLLSGIAIEELRARHWLFDEFPERLPGPPDWTIHQEPTASSQELRRKVKGCDQCKENRVISRFQNQLHLLGRLAQNTVISSYFSRPQPIAMSSPSWAANALDARALIWNAILRQIPRLWRFARLRRP